MIEAPLTNQSAAFFSLEDQEPQETSLVAVTEEAEDLDDDGAVFIGAIFTFVEGELQTFIGLAVAPGYALVVTGAQHGVLGPSAFLNMSDVLAEFGLKPRIIETLKMNAVGIGGTSSFQKSAEIPVGIAGASGTLTIHVVPQEVPFLLHVGFLRKLGMIMDLPEKTNFWKNLNK